MIYAPSADVWEGTVIQYNIHTINSKPEDVSDWATFFKSNSATFYLSNQRTSLYTKVEQDISNPKRIIIFIFLPRDNTFIFSLGPRKTASNCRQWFKVFATAHAALADLLKTSSANAAVTNVCVVVLWHHTLQVNVYKGQTWKHRLISFSLKDSLLFSHIVCVAVARVERLMQR